MRSLILVAGGSWLIAASLALACSGVAGASPSVVGMTFDKAQEAMQSAGLNAEVSTSTGTVLQQGDCIVVNQVIRSPSQFGFTSVPAKVLLSLNCNAAVASPGKPGNSAASPQGQLAKKEQQAETWRSDTPDGQAWCQKAQVTNPEWFPVAGCAT